MPLDADQIAWLQRNRAMSGGPADDGGQDQQDQPQPPADQQQTNPQDQAPPAADQVQAAGQQQAGDQGQAPPPDQQASGQDQQQPDPQQTSGQDQGQPPDQGQALPDQQDQPADQQGGDQEQPRQVTVTVITTYSSTVRYWIQDLSTGDGNEVPWGSGRPLIDGEAHGPKESLTLTCSATSSSGVGLAAAICYRRESADGGDLTSWERRELRDGVTEELETIRGPLQGQPPPSGGSAGGNQDQDQPAGQQGGDQDQAPPAADQVQAAGQQQAGDQGQALPDQQDQPADQQGSDQEQPVGPGQLEFTNGTPPADQGDTPDPENEDVPATFPGPPDAGEYDLFFDYDDAHLTPSDEKALTRIHQKYRERGTSEAVNIVGYASVEGKEPHNKELSSARAEAVRVYLVNLGIAADIVTAFGFGPTKMFSADDLRQNRRAVISPPISLQPDSGGGDGNQGGGGDGGSGGGGQTGEEDHQGETDGHGGGSGADPSPDRPLTPDEISNAQVIFGKTLDYSKVTLSFATLASEIAATRSKKRTRSVTIGNTIHLDEDCFTAGTNDLTPRGKEILIHELTHVWQYQHEGWSYAVKALYAQNTEENPYNWREYINQPWSSWNPEAQGQAVEDYNRALHRANEGKATSQDYSDLGFLQEYMDNFT